MTSAAHSFPEIAYCPCYISQNMYSIVCQGVVPDSVCEQRFRGEKERKAFRAKYCCSKIGLYCPLQPILSERNK